MTYYEEWKEMVLSLISIRTIQSQEPLQRQVDWMMPSICLRTSNRESYHQIDLPSQRYWWHVEKIRSLMRYILRYAFLSIYLSFLLCYHVEWIYMSECCVYTIQCLPNECKELINEKSIYGSLNDPGRVWIWICRLFRKLHSIHTDTYEDHKAPYYSLIVIFICSDKLFLQNNYLLN